MHVHSRLDDVDLADRVIGHAELPCNGGGELSLCQSYGGAVIGQVSGQLTETDTVD